MKKWCIFLASLTLGCACFAGEPVQQVAVEPELDLFLADNPDIASQVNPERHDNTQELDPVEIERAKLSAVKIGMDSIFQDQLFLAQASIVNQTELLQLKLIMDAEILSENGCIEVLQHLASTFKIACLMLEALSVKYHSEEYRFLNPLDFIELSQAKFDAFKELLNLYFNSTYHYDAKEIVWSVLPARLKKSVRDYLLLGFTQKSSDACWIAQVLDTNFYDKYPVLAEEYLDVVSGFYKFKNYQEQIDCAAFINKTDKAINTFVNKISLGGILKLDSYFLNIYLVQLIKIKNYFVTFNKPISEKSKLLVKFKLLLDNEKIEQLCINSTFCCFFNLYCNVLHKFFDDSLSLNCIDLQIFELECKLEKFRRDKQIPLLKRWIYKPGEVYVFIEEMEELLKEVRGFVNQELTKNEEGFFSSLFSGKWMDSGKIKGMRAGSAEIFLGIMEQFFDRRFNNFKEAAFYLLAQTSPLLAAGLIYKIAPHLPGELKEQFGDLFGSSGQPEPDSSGSDNKILDFISKNPEIFEKLCEIKPEIVDRLAQVVAQNLIVEKV